jgi:hypothetical protein
MEPRAGATGGYAFRIAAKTARTIEIRDVLVKIADRHDALADEQERRTSADQAAFP